MLKIALIAMFVASLATLGAAAASIPTPATNPGIVEAGL